MQNYAHVETKTNTILINNANNPLHNDFLFLVQGTELMRRDPFARLEDPVEIGQVVEPAGIADLGDVGSGVNKRSRSITKPDVNQIGRQSLAGSEPEETAEGAWAHSHEIRQLGQRDVLGVMLVDIFLDLHHPTALGVPRRMGERTAGKFPGPASGKDVKQAETARELDETILLADHSVDL